MYQSTDKSIDGVESTEDHNLEDTLDELHLEKLLAKFEGRIQNSEGGRTYHADDYTEESSDQLMDIEMFVEAFLSILHVPAHDITARRSIEGHAEVLFQKVDQDKDGLISWEDFSGYLIHHIQEQDSSKDRQEELSFTNAPRILKFSNIKDTVAKTLFVDNPPRFIVMSKDGIINILTHDLVIIRSTPMKRYQEEAHTPKGRRQIKQWVTDCVCMSNANKMVISTTNRDLHFYDMATPVYTQLFHLTAFPNAPMCLHYYHSRTRSMLFIGTDGGDVHILTFLTPEKSLFETPFRGSATCWKVFYSDLGQHSRLVLSSSFHRLHTDWVKRIRYIPDGDFLITCSSSPKDSLVFRKMDDKKLESYYFNLTKGIECFDYNKGFGVIVTGSVDHMVRLWDPYVTSKPMAVLKGHNMAVVDVYINEIQKQVFSYSKDGNLRSWDLLQHHCLQTVSIKFPFSSATFDHSLSPLHVAGHPHNLVLVAAEDCVAELKLPLPKNLRGHVGNYSHQAPVTGITFCEKNNLLISVCEGSVINIWDVNTGHRVFRIKEAHGKEEICALQADEECEFLVTAARDGTIKVWNLQTGLLEKELENISAEEITDIVILPKMKSIFLVGWSRKILAYHNFKITKEEVMKPDLKWLKFDHHQDDILACSFYPSNILATSTYDGEVYIWLVDRGRLKGKLKRRSVTGDEAKEHRLSLMRSVAGHLTRRQESREQTVRIVTPFETEEGRRSSVRQDERSASRASSPQRMPSRRARQLAKPHQSAYSNQMRAIELMVFLTAREHEHGAVLVASNGTQVEFWSLYGNGRLVAKFLGQLPADGLLTALATNSSNDFLITGDNSGNVVFWQIGQYGLFETLAEVTNELVNKERKKSTISTVNTKPPPIHLTLNCHPDYAITGLVCIDSIGVLVTSSTDFSVKLWTSSGEPIGMFGQRQKWNLRHLGKAAELTEEKSQHEEDEVGSEADSMDVPEEAEAQEEAVEEKLVESTGNKLPAINTTKVKEKPSQIVQDMKRAKASPVYILRSEVVDAIDKKKLEWSLLGEKYNSEFERRMQNREKRRTKVGQVEEMSYLGYGGLTNVCAPFKALHTSDPIEFRLPEGLPGTSKAVPTKKEVDPFPLNI